MSLSGALTKLRAWLQRWGVFAAAARPVPDALWRQAVQCQPVLARRSPAELARLRTLAQSFLAQKEFSGAAGLVVTDAMAVTVAALACLPVLGMGPKGLALYRDFKGIVLHPGAMLARRRITDEAGVVHHYAEALVGEAMDGGPVTLSWDDVLGSASAVSQGHNVVIHEFVHKIDMLAGGANGCPPLPSRAAQTAWQATMAPAYERFRQQVVLAQRFGEPPPWLDAYGAESPVEFFAVAAEAYFVNPERFVEDFPDVAAVFDRFFKKNSA